MSQVLIQPYKWHLRTCNLRDVLGITCHAALFLSSMSACVCHVAVRPKQEPRLNASPPLKDGEKEKKDTPQLTRLAFHSDQGATDLIALLSLANAKSGGESKWVSGLAIHNELLRRGRKVGRLDGKSHVTHTRIHDVSAAVYMAMCPWHSGKGV